MFQTIKNYWEEFSILPNPVKMFITAALVLGGGFSIYSGLNTYFSVRKIERLERQNRDLNSQAQTSLEKAARAEQTAANEALRAAGLESQIKTLEQKTKLQDEKLKNQTLYSDNLRRDLQRVRVSRPANVSTDELERRLKTRYGQTGND